VAYFLDVSLDRFATTYKRYATHYASAMDLVSPATEVRIVQHGMGVLQRAFAPDHGVTASTIEVTLANTDGGADWFVDRTSFANVQKAQFRLTCLAYDANNPSDSASKVLGLFVCMNPPVRNGSRIELSLADNVLGDAGEVVSTPTIRDWCAIDDPWRPTDLAAIVNGGLTDYGGGLYAQPDQWGQVKGFNFDSPIQLAFGTDITPVRVYQDCFVICAVAGSAGSLPISDITAVNYAPVPLSAALRASNGSYTSSLYSAGNLPQRYARYDPNGNPIGSSIFWTVRRTPDIVKNGKTFHLLWIQISLTTQNGGSEYLAKQGFDVSDVASLFYGYGVYDLLSPITVHGALFSHPANDITADTGQPTPSVALDLLTYYTRATVPIDTASFTAMAKLRALPANGVVVPGAMLNKTQSLGDGAMVKALRGLCSAGNFDIFVRWDGTFVASAQVSDFSTLAATPAVLDETLFKADVTDRIPSVTERGAPFNRLFFSKGGQRYGPYDDAASIAAWGKVISTEINVDWCLYLPTGIGRDNASIRTLVTATTWLNGLNYELGDYVTFSWSRGALGGPYTANLFRIEGIALDPASSTVQLTLSWQSDLGAPSNLPYLLDDETLATRVAYSAGRTITLTTTSTTVVFASGSLLTDGVTAGDTIIVLDAAETSPTGFQRNRVLNIISITDATHLVVDASDFGTGGPFTLAGWEIRRGALTYRANAAVFGKLSSATGFFSDGTTIANKLLDG
jgi:hypothetical protein